MRTIESPGVEIREIDLSLNQNLPVGTNVFALGYCTQGPTDEIINVTSISEFEQIYGIPTNAAERYLYHTAEQILQSPGNLLITRLPYGSGEGAGYADQYSALVYPVIGYSTQSGVSNVGSETPFASANQFYFGAPVHVNLSNDQYTSLIQGNIQWAAAGGIASDAPSVSALGNAGMIIINDAKTVVDDTFSGYYVSIADNTTINPYTSYTAVSGVVSVDATNSYFNIPNSRLTFNLTQPASGISGSTSEIIENVPPFDFNSHAYDDSLIITVFKLRKSIYAQDPLLLDQVLTESYVGSLDATRKVQISGGGAPASYFIQDVVNKKSSFIKLLVNPNISKNLIWHGTTGAPQLSAYTFNSATPAAGTARNYMVPTGYMKHSDNLYPLGSFASASRLDSKDIGNTIRKVQRNLILAANNEVLPIDIVVEAGLGTVWTTARNAPELDLGAKGDFIFDDSVYLDLTPILTTTGAAPAGQLYDDFATMYNVFNTFAEQTRRDHIFISDPLRQVFVQGPNSKVKDTRNFVYSRDIYWALRNLYATANSSYACTYGNWGKKYDTATDTYCWLPMSGSAAKMMCQIDANFYPWTPSGGLNRGIIENIVELAITPTQKQRDLLYRANINPVAFFPQDGFVFMGQKTLLRKSSSFDRINVRRLFLVLEKSCQAVLRYFIMEPNSIFTRTRLRNTIEPVFSVAKNNDGVYDFLIICDERNNTPDVIDRNELVVDIYIKAVRAGEFILVNFISTKTSQDFNELI
jgi:hypothetical protein